MKNFIQRYKTVILCGVLVGIPVGSIVGWWILNPDINITSTIIAVGTTAVFTNLVWLIWGKKK